MIISLRWIINLKDCPDHLGVTGLFDSRTFYTYGL